MSGRATITCAEARVKRGEIEASIAKLIVEFEKSTGASVLGVELDYQRSMSSSGPKLNRVTVTAELGRSLI